MEMERSRVFKEGCKMKRMTYSQTGVRESGAVDRERHRDGETEETGRQTDGVKRDRDGENTSNTQPLRERWKGSLGRDEAKQRKREMKRVKRERADEEKPGKA